jgi:hypothetical protein
MLSDLFSELSEARVNFVKTEHSVRITEWIIANAPEELEEIVTLLRSKLLPN